MNKIVYKSWNDEVLEAHFKIITGSSTKFNEPVFQGRTLKDALAIAYNPLNFHPRNSSAKESFLENVLPLLSNNLLIELINGLPMVIYASESESPNILKVLRKDERDSYPTASAQIEGYIRYKNLGEEKKAEIEKELKKYEKKLLKTDYKTLEEVLNYINPIDEDQANIMNQMMAGDHNKVSSMIALIQSFEETRELASRLVAQKISKKREELTMNAEMAMCFESPYAHKYPYSTLADADNVILRIISAQNPKENMENAHSVDDFVLSSINGVMRELQERGIVNECFKTWTNPYLLENYMLGEIKKEYDNKKNHINLFSNDDIDFYNKMTPVWKLLKPSDKSVYVKKFNESTKAELEDKNSYSLEFDNKYYDVMGNKALLGMIHASNTGDLSLLEGTEMVMNAREAYLNHFYENGLKRNEFAKFNVPLYEKLLKKIIEKNSSVLEQYPGLKPPSIFGSKNDEEVLMSLSPIVRLEVNAWGVMNYQNKTHNTKLTRDDLMDVFSKYWALAHKKEGLRDFVDENYSFKNGNWVFIVKEIPNLVMTPEELDGWAVKLVTELLLNKNMKSKNEAVSAYENIEDLAQHETLLVKKQLLTENRSKILKF